MNLSKRKHQLKRIYYRHSYLSDLSITFEGHGKEIRLHTPDLSTQGMFIHTSLELPEGSVVRVKFRLRRTNFLVNVRSEVRYFLPGVGVGVEFVEISREAQDAIAEELGIGASAEETS